MPCLSMVMTALPEAPWNSAWTKRPLMGLPDFALIMRMVMVWAALCAQRPNTQKRSAAVQIACTERKLARAILCKGALMEEL